MSNQIDITGGARVRGLNGVITGTTGVLSSLPINTANGIPQLDSSGKILVSQLPNSVMEFLGTWDAATNTPTLANGTGNAGDVYLCNVAGTVNFGAGPIAFIVGDYVVYSGSTWERSGGAVGTVTSVGLTESGDSLTITGSPVTTSGTINIGFAGTNLQYINGAGNLTTFPTLITSIGLSMPSAFSVANSPLTANGTIAVTGAGVASQYIRGDGTLADFPTSGGGGSSVSYYLNGGTNQGTIGGTTYYEMSKTAVVGTGVDFAKSGDGLIVSFLTDANDPAQLNIPAGNWNYEIYASMSSNGGTPQLYAELYKYDGTTFTLISTSSNEIIYDGTALNLYTFAMAVPATTLTLTDRLAVKLYATNSGGKTTTIHTQDGHLCQVITTFSTGITALNGLTAQVQYFQTGTSGTDFNISSTTATHTFNLPTASAANRGALSSADWTTFNNKQSALTNPITGTGTTNTLPKFTAASTIGNSNITDTGSLITLGSNTYISSGGLGIGVAPTANVTARLAKNITGGSVAIGVYQLGTVQSDVTGIAYGFWNLAGTAATTFNLGNYNHFYASQSTLGAGSSISVQRGFYVDPSIVGASTNYAFQGSIPSGTNRWNIYMDGTANNYMAGSLGIGTTSLTGYTLRLQKSITGGTSAYGIEISGAIQSDVTNFGILNSTYGHTQSANFTLTELVHYYASANTTFPNVTAGGAVTNQYGFNVTSSLIGATNNYGFFGNIAIGTNRWNLYMNGTANNYMAGSLGIGSTSLTGYNLRIQKALTGATNSRNIWIDSQIASDVTSVAAMFGTSPSTQAASFTLSNLIHYYANQSTLGAGSSVTNQYGFWADSGITGATNNYGFYGNIPSGTNRWNLYMNGTAPNHMAGSLGIGTTSLTARSLVVSKNITGSTSSIGILQDGVIQSDVVTQAIYNQTEARTAAASFTLTNIYHYLATQGTFGAGSSVTNQAGFWAGGNLTGATNNFGFYGNIPSGTNRWNLYMNGTAANYMAGNLLLNTTTDAGYKLDVNGTGRFGSDNSNGDLTIISNSTPFLIRGRSPYSAAGLILTWGISPNTGIMCAPTLGFNTNATLGSTVGTRALTLSSTGAATFASSISFSGNADAFAVGSIFRNANRLFFGGDTGGYYFQNSANSVTTFKLLDNGAATFSSSVTATSFNSNNFAALDGSYATYFTYGEGGIIWRTGTTERMRLSTGNLLIGTATDSGQKLQVNGITQTNAIALAKTSFSSSTTMTDAFFSWSFGGAIGQTLTLYSSSGHNNMHFIKNESAVPLTISGTIMTLTSGAPASSIVLAGYKTMQIISFGSSAWYIMYQNV